ncbi:PDZ domain-containing protein [Candidatus Nomurabacteria bacterium]|nr:PDZ domain-containing protein [Candidatus Nomurabacteria bacterium]
MKKLFIFTILLISFSIGQNIHASTNDQIQKRYAGNFVFEDLNFEQRLWYINRDASEKYLLKDGVSITRLLNTFGQGISNQELKKLATSSESLNADYNLSHQLSGQIVLQIEENGEAWYINPLDDFRYKIDNGQIGFETAKTLALDISSDKLKDIPETKNPKFLANIETEIDFANYWKVWDILQNQYYKTEQADNKTLFYGSLKGLAQSLDDPYTEFFSPQNKEDFDNRLEGAVEGIGAMVDLIDSKVVVISPLADSPAERAGLEPEDQILKANNKDLNGLTLDQAISYIKGKAGSEVKLLIYRPEENRTFEVKIIREKVVLPNITGKILDNNLVYFKINIFALGLNQDFIKLKDQLVNNQTRGIILDLRNNPGGYTSEAINLAGHWLDEGDLILEEKYPSYSQLYHDHAQADLNLPTVVLTNSGTASASEIVTSALKINKNIKTVGKQSFGKGTGQGIYQFSDGSALKYTVFEWLDAQGNSIQGSGISPDYEIKNNKSNDLQLKKAQELLR